MCNKQQIKNDFESIFLPDKIPILIIHFSLKQYLLIIFPKCYSLGFFDRSCTRPQQPDMLAIMENWDVLSAHLQSHPQLLVADTKTAKVGADLTILNNFLLANNLAIHHKTWKIQGLSLLSQKETRVLFGCVRLRSDLIWGLWPGWKWLQVYCWCWSTERRLSLAALSWSEDLRPLHKHH